MVGIATACDDDRDMAITRVCRTSRGGWGEDAEICVEENIDNDIQDMSVAIVTPCRTVVGGSASTVSASRSSNVNHLGTWVIIP